VTVAKFDLLPRTVMSDQRKQRKRFVTDWVKRWK